MRSVTILGATGSIGASTLDLIRRNRAEWRVVALTARSQAAELARLAREFKAELAVVSDEACLPALREALAGSGIAAAGGSGGLVEAAARGADVTVAAAIPPYRPAHVLLGLIAGASLRFPRVRPAK